MRLESFSGGFYTQSSSAPSDTFLAQEYAHHSVQSVLELKLI